MATMSIGFGRRFAPYDNHMIRLLWNKINNVVMPFVAPVVECDIYGENATPWELFRDRDGYVFPWHPVIDYMGKFIPTEEILYVFTNLTKVGKTGTKQKNRTAGCGCWHGNNSPEYVLDRRGGNVIGLKKYFKFRIKKTTAKEAATLEAATTEWIMHEYSLLDRDDYVFCKIKRIISSPAKVQKRRMYAAAAAAAPEAIETGEDEINGFQSLAKKMKSSSDTSSNTTTAMINADITGVCDSTPCAGITSEVEAALNSTAQLQFGVGGDNNQDLSDDNEVCAFLQSLQDGGSDVHLNNIRIEPEDQNNSISAPATTGYSSSSVDNNEDLVDDAELDAFLSDLSDGNLDAFLDDIIIEPEDQNDILPAAVDHNAISGGGEASKGMS